MIKRVYIEITNICNLNCSFCSKHSRPFKSMSLSEFTYIISQVKEITDFIYLHVQGEPLLHPDLDKILDICDKNEMKVHITTNATLLKDHLNIFNHHSLRKMALSMHAYDELNYNLDALLENVYKLNENKHSDQYLELRFWNRQNLKENSQYLISKLKEKYTFEETKKKNSYKLDYHLYLHFDNQFTWPDQSINQDNIHGTCTGVKNMICILSNGSVTPCCLDEDAHIYLGNVFKQSLKDIIQGPKYTSFINNLNNNILQEELCRKCTYRIRFDKTLMKGNNDD